MSSTSLSSSGTGKAVIFGLELAALAAAIAAIVIFIRNDKNKTNPNYKKPSWLNLAWAAAIAFAIGFVLSELKHRIQAKELVKTTQAGLTTKYQKWWNPETATPEPSVAPAASN